MSTMQGSAEISGEYLCLENAALSPRLMNVLPGEAGYPTTMELTLPSSMTVIPFGSSEAEVVAQHDDGTATWRYEDDSAGGIVYAGTTSDRISRPAAPPSSSTMAGSIRR